MWYFKLCFGIESILSFLLCVAVLLHSILWKCQCVHMFIVHVIVETDSLVPPETDSQWTTVPTRRQKGQERVAQGTRWVVHASTCRLQISEIKWRLLKPLGGDKVGDRVGSAI